MNKQAPVKTRLLFCLLAGTLSCSAFAQNNGLIVESQGITPGQAGNQSTAAPAPSGNSDALTLLLEQNRQLRAEVQALRGMVEEQGFELRRLQRDSLNRYTNMDERLTALETNAVASSTSTAQRPGGTAISATDSPANPRSTAASNNANTSNSPAAASSGLNRTPLTNSVNNSAANNSSAPARNVRPAGRGTLQPAVLSEQQLYQMAYDSVINSNFERSIAEFDQYLSVYPEGRFVTNAHYWKGQAYLYLNRYDEAQSSYEIIIDQFPDAAKLPDAMYGLALSFQGLGNISRARQLLNDIKRRFPNTGVANLADTRLLSLD